MFRKITDRLNAAAASVGISSTNAAAAGGNGDNLQTLIAMGFDSGAATNALEATGGDVERAAELLLLSSQGGGGGGADDSSVQAASPPPPPPPAARRRQQEVIVIDDDGDVAMQRAMEESAATEQQRRWRLQQGTEDYAAQANPSRTAAVHKAGEAALARLAGEQAGGGRGKRKKNGAANKVPPASAPAPAAAATAADDDRNLLSAAAAMHVTGKKPASAPSSLSHLNHPGVKILPKLQDKSKEEQVLRCADRLKAYPQAVDTLYRALTTIQRSPDDDRYRKVDKTTAGYKRSLENVPGGEDLFLAMNFRRRGNDELVLDRSAVDPALLFLGVSALEQTKLTDEYQSGKRKLQFAKDARDIQMSVNTSEAEAIARSGFMSKCPSEPSDGRGALMQVRIADETIRRRFDGDDTLSDVLHWLGGHGSVIPEKILSREWCVVDLNRYPVHPIDCEKSQHHTLQYIGCWPSGKLEILPSSEEWRRGGPDAGGGDVRGSSRGLGSAPRDAL